MPRTLRLAVILALLASSGCATLPSGPSVMVLPGTGKTFDRFRADEHMCRQYAYDQISGMTPAQAAADSGVGSALLGSALGAAAGAAANGGEGAAVGAGIGLLFGALVGTQAAAVSASGVQQRYDYAYVQCMYASGHRVPMAAESLATDSGPRVRRGYYPPPPPPPPPRYR